MLWSVNHFVGPIFACLENIALLEVAIFVMLNHQYLSSCHVVFD